MRRGLTGCVSPRETQQGQDLASCRPVNTDAVGSGRTSQDPVTRVVPGCGRLGLEALSISFNQLSFLLKKDCVLANDQG